MIKLARKHVTLNSLWSVFYCVLVLIAHAYLLFLCIRKYDHHKKDSVWNSGTAPPEVNAYIGLVVISIIVLPFFTFASLLKIGNHANDGAKLGRDHALDSNTNTLGGKIHSESGKRLWQIFPPFSSVLHMSAAFFILLPEVLMTAAEVKHGHRPTGDLWSSELDFLFSSDRAYLSDIIGQSNITVLENSSYFVVPSPILPSSGAFNSKAETILAFVSLSTALTTFAVRYASVFWFTNKIFGLIFAVQLLLMTVESLFAICGSFLLFKVAANLDKYQTNINLLLGSAAVIIIIVVFSGIILLLSSIAVFVYGANYFQEKFKLVDSKHNPEVYRKQVTVVQGSCQGYKTHTFAMVSLVSLAVLKGPIIYDLVSLYRVTKDSLCLICVIVTVCYMVSWVILWTVLTLKHQWRFRILDYVPLNKPVFMISNDNLIKSGSYHGSSSSIDRNRRKRPSSLPSDITASESGFGDANSSEDERFELSLPPLPEVPGLVYSRRKGSTHSLDRKSRRSRNHQRVTFHETVKRSTSTDDDLYPRRRGRPVNITADVHRTPVGSRPISSGRITPVELEMINSRAGQGLHSTASESEIVRLVLNNDPYRGVQVDSTTTTATTTPTAPTERIDSGRGEGLLSFKDLNSKTDKNSRSNLKSSNMQTQTLLNNAIQKTNNNTAQTTRDADAIPALDSPSNTDKGRLFPKNQTRDITVTNQLYPRQLEVVDKKHELSRRDSANYSLTSSQDTASNDSEHAHQQHALCSQV